jgi:2-amino-4-hydroxy-6-hydroxymethyldihydropteridine diphosphokinase
MLAYIGLGSNQNRPVQQLLQALQNLQQEPDIKLCNASSFYQSKALVLPGTKAQSDYVNAVAKLDTDLSAEQLLQRLQAIENRQGRVRTEKWGARTLDLDILLYDDQFIQTDSLTIPHAQIRHRNFVIQPLAEIAADILIPGVGAIADLAKETGWDGLKKLKSVDQAAEEL